MGMKSAKSVFGWSIVAILVALSILIAQVVRSPDRDLTMVRQAPTGVSQEMLSDAVHFLANWPLFHHEMYRAIRVGPDGKELPLDQQVAEKGARIHLVIEPKKQHWKRFTVETEILEYRRGELIRLQLLRDSTGKLDQVFDPLVWEIALRSLEDSNGTEVRATITGRTQNWRARFFGIVSKNILMHQVFYVNFTKLLELTHLTRSTQDPVSTNFSPLGS